MDEFTSFTDVNELQRKVAEYKDKFLEMRMKRNYIQTDRDMVSNFYDNVQMEMRDIKALIFNRETEIQVLEEDHRTEKSNYLQKVKHLEFEQEKNTLDTQGKGEVSLKREKEDHESKIEAMKKRKQDLKKEDETISAAQTEEIERKKRKYELSLNHKIQGYKEKELGFQQTYENMLKKLREELNLKLKVEIHEIEERKNQHINDLMNNHEKKFAELKEFYNKMTAENIDQIRKQQEEIAKIHNRRAANSITIATMKDKNKDLKEKLDKSISEKNELEQKVKHNFTKDKMSENNLRIKLMALKEKLAKLTEEKESLDKKMLEGLQKKQDLEHRFNKIAEEVERHANEENTILAGRLGNMQSDYEQKVDLNLKGADSSHITYLLENRK